jgi:ABC-type branched-subunit amino acid transport system substrate-binding protein
VNRSERFSMINVAVTVVFVTIHHLYSLGPGAFALGATLLALPALLMWWLRATGSRVAFTGYLLTNAWLIVGFGLVNGLWKTTLPLYLGTLLSALSPAFPRPQLGPYAFEASGILSFVGSLFVLWAAAKLIRERRAEGRESTAVPTRALGAPALATAGVVALMATAAAFIYLDRDRWVPPRDGVVRIGVIVPTQGPYALLGGSFVKAVEMARDDLRNTKYRYELLIRDSGPDPARARSVIERTINEDKVNAILGGVSLIGQVTQPFARQARIPHACVCTVKSIGDGVYNFTNIPSPEAEAVRWVQEAQRRGIRRVAVIAQDYPSINNHVKALKAEMARRGMQLTYERRFDDSAREFRGTIALAKASRPDVYYVEGLHPVLEILGQQLGDVGIHNLSAVVAPSLSTRPELFEGAWYTDSNLRDIGFRKRFEDKYPRVQFATHMMPYAYDSFNMIVQAYEHGQNPAVYLRKMTSYEGTADRLTKAQDSGNFQSTPAVWMIRNGKPVLLDSPQHAKS